MGAPKLNVNIPLYTHRPLMRFVENHKIAFQLFHLCITGIVALQELPDYTEMFIKGGYRYRPELPDADAKKLYEEQRAELQGIAAFANHEESCGFPLLHAQTLVTFWGALEAAIEDMLLGILCHEPEVLRSAPFSKIKLAVADFEILDKDERMRLVLSEISRDRRQGRSAQGIDYFEFMLAPFGLSGPVEDDVKKNFWTMHNLRNVIVHRASIADPRLVEACPWLGLKPGDQVVVTSKQLHEFHHALPNYVSTLARRLADRYRNAPWNLNRPAENNEPTT